MLPRQLLKQPTLVRLMIGIALIILPAVAWVDFQQGYYFSAAVELAAAGVLFGMVFLIGSLGVNRSIQVTLVLMCILAVLGSVEKLDSAPNFAWFSIMPFLYISIGGIRLGSFLTAAHFLAIAAFYLSFAKPVVDSLAIGTWIQVGLAYLTATGMAISYEHVQRQLRKRLHALADHDPLTGLLNRRGMEKRLTELKRLLHRHPVPVTLALLDIDHFKRVNDEYGHDVGDRVLKELAHEMRSVLRESDYIARWGGEEFLVALTSTNMAAASAVLERLRAQIAESSEFSIPSLTLSLGAAEWSTGADLAGALKQADIALYGAKGRGRNALVPASETIAGNGQWTAPLGAANRQLAGAPARGS